MPMVTIDLPASGQIKRIRQHLLEFFLLGNDVVGRQNRHDGAGRALPDNGRAQRDGGAGVAPDRFGDDVLLGQFGQLLADFRRLGGVGDDENVFQRHQRQHAIDGLLQERMFRRAG